MRYNPKKAKKARRLAKAEVSRGLNAGLTLLCRDRMPETKESGLENLQAMNQHKQKQIVAVVNKSVSFFSQRLLEGERLGGDAEAGAVDAEDYRQFLVGLMGQGRWGKVFLLRNLPLP